MGAAVRDQIRAFDPQVEPYVSYVCHTSGKRIRPALAILALQAACLAWTGGSLYAQSVPKRLPLATAAAIAGLQRQPLGNAEIRFVQYLAFAHDALLLNAMGFE